MRNYVYENALCRVAMDFDARLCKIRRVALLVDGDDVANKRFVQQNMQILEDRQNEIENKLGLLQSSVNISLNYMQQKACNFQRSIESNREENDLVLK